MIYQQLAATITDIKYGAPGKIEFNVELTRVSDDGSCGEYLYGPTTAGDDDND
jgi:phage protein U